MTSGEGHRSTMRKHRAGTPASRRPRPDVPLDFLACLGCNRMSDGDACSFAIFAIS
jgi:hypothetical protein